MVKITAIKEDFFYTITFEGNFYIKQLMGTFKRDAIKGCYCLTIFYKTHDNILYILYCKSLKEASEWLGNNEKHLNETAEYITHKVWNCESKIVKEFKFEGEL